MKIRIKKLTALWEEKSVIDTSKVDTSMGEVDPSKEASNPEQSIDQRWIEMKIPPEIADLWEPGVPTSKQTEFINRLDLYITRLKMKKPPFKPGSNEQKLYDFHPRAHWMLMRDETGVMAAAIKQLPMRNFLPGQSVHGTKLPTYDGQDIALLAFEYDLDQILNPNAPKQKNPKQKNVKYENVFENWRDNTLDEAREDDLRKKYGPRFFVLKRFTGASELMEDMIRWVNRTDYDEFRRREMMFASQRRMGDISTEEYMQRVNDLRGDNRPTHRKARLKYLDWMIKQVDFFVNHMNIPDAEGNHSTLQRLERLADKESAELTGNAIRRYVPDYVKNPGPNIKAYENAVKMISTFRNGLKASVADFDKNKNAMKEKDINRYKYLHTLRQSLKREVREPRIDKSITGFENRVPKGEAKFFRLPRPFTMVRPLSTKASCAYGSGKWCIAQKGNAHFDDYTDDGLVFYNVQDHSRRKEDKFSILAFQVTTDSDWDGYFTNWDIEGFWDYPNRWHTKLDRLRTEYGDYIVDQIVKIIDKDMENFGATIRRREEKNADPEPGAPRQVDWGDDNDYDVQDDENINERKAKLSIKVKIAEKKKKPCKKAKGKRYVKRVNGKCRSYGQAGKAKSGGDRIRPGTKKGDAYCARSAKIKKCKNPPCANDLSRKKWKCRGNKSMKSE